MPQYAFLERRKAAGKAGICDMKRYVLLLLGTGAVATGVDVMNHMPELQAAALISNP